MRPEFDELAAGYDAALDDPWRTRFADNADFFIDQKCRAMLREIGRRNGSAAARYRMLDVGCGRGPAVRFLRDRWPTFGTDVSLEMVRNAPAGLPLVVQDPLALPFADGVFDVVFAMCIYHHLERAHHLAHLSEMARVAKPGGLVFVFEHNPFNPVTQLIVRRAPIDRGCTLIRPGAFRRTFEGAGLTEIATRYMLFLPQGLARRAPGVEDALRQVPLGGQYYIVGRKPG